MRRRVSVNEAESALASVLSAAAYNKNQKEELIRIVSEICMRESVVPEELVTSIDSEVTTEMSGPDTIKHTLEYLRNRRYPELAARMNKFSDTVKKLGLTGVGIEAVLPRNLDGEKIAFNNKNTDPSKKKYADEFLEKLRNENKLEELYEVLR